MDSAAKTVSLIDQLNELKSKLATGDDVAATNEALDLTRSLGLALGNPANMAIELAFTPLITVAARIAVDLSLFKLIAEHGPVSSVALAAHSGGEELLIIRILRPLSAGGLVDELDERVWGPNPVTHAMTKEGIAAAHRFLGEFTHVAAQKGPQYLREHGYRCPTDPTYGFMQYAFETQLGLFDLIKSKPNLARDFNVFMGDSMGGRKLWFDWFPVEQQLLENASEEDGSVLLVDIGAGKGHDVIAFKQKFPAAKGRFVIQDLPAVTDTLTSLDGIEIIPYDFFTEQPVKGARAYFFRHIFHGWTDDTCLQIFERVKAAMKPGYSKLLISEMIIPEKGARTFHAMFDLTMMTANGGMERSERHWYELLERAGFSQVKVWSPLEVDADGIVEAMI